MAVVGYVPFEPDGTSAEARWVADALGCEVRQPAGVPDLNRPASPLPDLASLAEPLAPLLRLRWVIAEGPGGFLWAALLRSFGFAGGVTILPYLNPRRWWDVAAAAVYRRFRDPRDRVFLGSTPSARIYRRLGIEPQVGEPYGIDDRRFRPRPRPFEVLERFAIPRGRLLLFAGRCQADKDLYRLLRVALKARILFPDLQVVLASHVIDEDYVATIRRQLGPESGVHFVARPGCDELADLYGAADVFATAATSHFETFGRAPAEALACGTPAVAPRYDGFAEVLDQPGGSLVGVESGEDGPHVREDELLRTVYDVLSAPRRVPSHVIAEAAHRRFGRSRSLRLLAHVAAEEPRAAPRVALPPADLALPSAWSEAIAAMDALSPLAALRQVWTDPGRETLAAFDAGFVHSVRLALCDVAPMSIQEAVRAEEAVPCR
ncbi:MAG TPA: glycosyltransferase [Thermoanaerobaculia bacterium]|nr:glycosyltransferase [Thermoanaerobaculia bacterium]